jgi:hypothetical protein
MRATVLLSRVSTTVDVWMESCRGHIPVSVIIGENIFYAYIDYIKLLPSIVTSFSTQIKKQHTCIDLIFPPEVIHFIFLSLNSPFSQHNQGA